MIPSSSIVDVKACWASFVSLFYIQQTLLLCLRLGATMLVLHTSSPIHKSASLLHSTSLMIFISISTATLSIISS